MASEVELPADAIVIRFTPVRPDRVLKSALAELNESGDHAGISCFATIPRGNESERSVHSRLLGAAELSHINLANNRNFYVCSRASRITSLGFAFLKDGYEGEISEHYCVDVGTRVTEETLLPLLAAFLPAKVSEARS